VTRIAFAALHTTACNNTLRLPHSLHALPKLRFALRADVRARSQDYLLCYTTPRLRATACPCHTTTATAAFRATPALRHRYAAPARTRCTVRTHVTTPCLRRRFVYHGLPHHPLHPPTGTRLPRALLPLFHTHYLYLSAIRTPAVPTLRFTTRFRATLPWPTTTGLHRTAHHLSNTAIPHCARCLTGITATAPLARPPLRYRWRCCHLTTTATTSVSAQCAAVRALPTWPRTLWWTLSALGTHQPSHTTPDHLPPPQLLAYTPTRGGHALPHFASATTLYTCAHLTHNGSSRHTQRAKTLFALLRLVPWRAAAPPHRRAYVLLQLLRCGHGAGL